MKTSSPPSLADYGLLILLASIFGSAFMLISVGIESFQPLTIVAIRQGLASALFVAVMFWVGQRFPAFGRVWLYILLAAVLGNALPFFLVAWGQEKVDAGLAAILTSSTPIMALIVGQLFSRDEKLSLPKFAGVLLGFAGVVILLGFENLTDLGDEQLRQYALLAAALSYAVNAFVLKKLSDMPRFATIASVMLVSFLVVVPFCLLLERPWTMEPALLPVLAVIALGILSTGAGNLLRFEIVHRQGALFLTQLSYLIPPFGLFWAWLFLGEVPTGRIFLAMSFILAGIFVVRLGETRGRNKRTSTGLAK